MVLKCFSILTDKVLFGYAFVALISFAVINCSYLLQEYIDSDKVNAGLIDTSVVDTTVWEKGYSEFIKSVNPVNRSFEEIQEKLTAYNKVIFNAFISDSSTFPLKQNDSIQLSITSDGGINLVSINSKIVSDTNKTNKINKSLSPIKFEESKEGEFYTKIQIHFPADSVNHFYLNPQITYGEAVRSKKSIMKVVMRYLPNMRYAYNKRLRTVPGISGKLTVKFCIDMYGRVIYVETISSTLNDTVLKKGYNRSN